MTAPAAAPGPGPIAAPMLRWAPQAAADRVAFASVLDSLPGAAAKSGASVAEAGPRTSNQARQGDEPSGQPDGDAIPGEGALLAALPFALQSALATNEPSTAVDVSQLAPAATRLASAGAANASTAAQAESAAARLTGERAFHFALSTSGGNHIFAAPASADAPALAPTADESAIGAIASQALASSGPRPTRDAALSPLSADGAGLKSAAAAEAGAWANSSQRPAQAAAQDPARAVRKSEAAAAPPSPAHVASPAAPSAKAEPRDKADARTPDPGASTGQPASQGAAFGAQPPAFAATVPSLGSDDVAAPAADAAPSATPAAAAPAGAAAPVKEIDVDLSPSGLEDVSMTMRLAGDKLSVVIRAASSQTLGSIEGARDAIADRLAAIGQPLDSLVVRQTGANANADANGNAGSPDESSTGGGRQSGQGADGQAGADDASPSRRGAARDRGF
jgi:hypothetical protein